MRTALIGATTDLIVEHGLAISVREIAARAGVNHGLIHTYFGSKEGLISASFDSITQRAVDALDDRGFPPPDLAERRGGEIAKALARVMLEAPDDPFSSHPVIESWRHALEAERPHLSDDDLDERVLVATALGLGWALFADHLTAILDVDECRRARIADRVAAMVADIGGIPDRSVRSPAGA